MSKTPKLSFFTFS